MNLENNNRINATTRTSSDDYPDISVFVRTSPEFKTLCTLVILSLVVLAVVKMLHVWVTRRYMAVKGLVGLDAEERKTKNLNTERIRLEQFVHEHEQTILREKELQSAIRKLAG